MPDLEKIYAYYVLDTLPDPGPQLDLPADYIVEPSPGSILLSYENHGNGTHTVTFEDGPIKLVATLVYVGTGRTDGTNPTFDLGTKRILNLISLGTYFEDVLHEQIHAFAEKAQTAVEAILVNPTGHIVHGDTIGDALRAIDDVEKHFWDRKR